MRLASFIFALIAVFQSAVAHLPATDTVSRSGSGRPSLGIALNDRPVPFLTMANSDTNWPLRWQAQIEITPGIHTLTATTVHPSNLYTNTTSVTFTNQAVDQTVLTYYSEGQLTQRVWKNSQGNTNRVETYDWDGRGRLLRFAERDVNGNGHDWSAVYDAFNRKLQTQTVPVTNDVAYASLLKTTTHLYDPLVEFMDLGVHVDDRWHWKVYGPDLNGVYGGMNGTGGWEATVSGPDAFYPTVADARGNILGAFDPELGAVKWNESRVTGYGSIPEHRPRSLGEGVPLWESGSWRGRTPEFSGMYWLGMRYYQPMGGYFISPDPVFDPGNPGGFSFAGGDPINYFDADGRLGKAVGREMYHSGSALVSGEFWGGMGSDTYDLGGRTINGVAQAGLVYHDMIAQSAWDSYGVLDEFQGRSQLYQNIYDDPSQGPTAGGILIGTTEAVANVGTLGLYGMGQGIGVGAATGDFTQVQDAALGSLPLSGYAKSLQGKGVNPWTGSATAAKGVNNAAHNAADAVKLNKSLASQQQLGEAGTIMAGTGGRVPFRDAGRVAQQYGGNPADWVKKTSSSHTVNATTFETHWVENIRTGQRVEFKTKFPGDD